MCRIHKQGLIKHDFQRPQSEKVRLGGQTDISQARMWRSELLADYYRTRNICFILTSAEEQGGSGSSVVTSAEVISPKMGRRTPGTEDEWSGDRKHLMPSHPSLPVPPESLLHLCCVEGSLSSTEEHRLIERRPSCSWSVTDFSGLNNKTSVYVCVCVCRGGVNGSDFHVC